MFLLASMGAGAIMAAHSVSDETVEVGQHKDLEAGDGRRRPTRGVLQIGRERSSRRPLLSGRNLWRILQWGVLISLVLYAAYQSHYIVFRASYFKLQSLRVTGNRTIPKEQLVAMSGLELGTPVFDVDRAAVVRRLLLVPRVERATVEQRGPSELVLDVVEKTPVARVYLDGEPLEVGRDGAVLGPADESRQDLPWVLGADLLPAGGGLAQRIDPRVVEGLATWLPVLATSPLAGFTSVAFPEPGKVVVLWHEIEFFLGDVGLFRRHAVYVPDLLALEGERGRRLQYVDFRFQDMVARFQPAN